jgi:hypothetical protein
MPGGACASSRLTARGALRPSRAALKVLVPYHPGVPPPDRNDIDIPVAIEIYRQSTVVMFVARMNHDWTPLAAASVQVLENDQACRCRVLQIVFTGDDIEIAVAVDPPRRDVVGPAQERHLEAGECASSKTTQYLKPQDHEEVIEGVFLRPAVLIWAVGSAFAARRPSGFALVVSGKGRRRRRRPAECSGGFARRTQLGYQREDASPAAR